LRAGISAGQESELHRAERCCEFLGGSGGERGRRRKERSGRFSMSDEEAKGSLSHGLPAPGNANRRMGGG